MAPRRTRSNAGDVEQAAKTSSRQEEARTLSMRGCGRIGASYPVLSCTIMISSTVICMHSAGQGERFRSLDAIRGLAALSVVLFHSVNAHPAVAESALGRALLYGWAGVFLFFPVSGYCICAAIDRRENGSVGRFLARRWRRIFPPYWASLVLTIVIGVAALPFNRGSLSDFLLPAPLWAAVM